MKFSLRELRARKNVTQREAAADLKISTTTYNAWERDISRVALGKVAKVADYFGVRIEDIAFDGDQGDEDCQGDEGDED